MGVKWPGNGGRTEQAKRLVHSQLIVIPITLRFLDLDTLLELTHLQYNDRVVGISVTVVLGQDLGSFGRPVVCAQPSWGLGDEECAGEDDDWWDELKAEWQPEGQLGLNFVGGVGDAGGEDGAGVEDWEVSVGVWGTWESRNGTGGRGTQQRD